MAKTFYKYGERDAISYVDWSQIGKNFSTMVDTELTRREDEKAAIQKGVDETMAFINDNPVGEYEAANDFSLFHSQNAQEYLVMADKMLKSGQISPQDFVRMRENLNTGTKGIYEVADSYQKRFKEVMDDVNSGDPKLSNIVYEQMISLEGLGRLSNTDAIIDTSSGRVNLSKYDVDENGVKRYTEAYSTGELKAFLQSDIQRFDVKGAVSDIVSSMGTLKEAYFEEAKRYGGMNILTKKLNMQGDSELEGVKESYQNWRDDSIDSYMSDINRASIIVDFLQGQGYKATTSKKAFDEDKTGKLLYVDPNNKAYLTDEQDSLARKTFATQLDNAINREYLESGAGSKAYPRSTTSNGSSSSESFGNYWMQVASSSSVEDKQAALDAAMKSTQAVNADIVGAKIASLTTGGYQIQVSKKDSQDNYTIDIPSSVNAEQWAGFAGQMVDKANIQKMIAANEGWTFIDSGFSGLESSTKGVQLERMTDQEIYDTYGSLPKEIVVDEENIASYDGVGYNMSDKVDVRKVFNLIIDNNPTLFQDIDVDSDTLYPNRIHIKGFVVNEDGNRVRKTENVDIVEDLDLNNSIESEFSRIILEMLGSEEAATRAERMRMRSETEFLPLESSKDTGAEGDEIFE